MKVVNPVIAVRVPATVYRSIKDAAKKSRRSLSDEVAHRFAQTFHWERAFGTARELIDNANRITTGTLHQAMIDAGYTPISTSDGTLWADPKSKISVDVKIALGEIKKQP